ncbi:SAV_2336 N-terminal domain-related protein [Streptomyces sp. NPDC058206]|uniref:SAV_2336 N-terminal domain-related protein n=1 Tax=Streptomyces sp. NPDC058206 TaxID=3346382 RepID=UPI0036EF20F1
MAVPDGELGEFVERLRALGVDPSARELAEALWFARFVGRPHLRSGTPGVPLADADGTEDEFRIDYTPPAWYTQHAESRRQASAGSGDHTRLYAERPSAGPRSAAQPATPDARAVRVRVPAATALPKPLVLQRALRPLQHYHPPVRTPALHLDEQLTAEQAADTRLLLPVLRAATRREARLRLLMDVSTSTGVWDTALGELRQICAGLGAFREVTVHYVREDGKDAGGRLVAATSRDGVRAVGAAEQLRDPTGRQLTLVLSDCAGPLWRSGRMQRLLHHWGQAAPVAVVQPLPQRMWRRTHLPALPGTLRRREGLGARLNFTSTDGEAPAKSIPVPVLSLSRTALGSWARLLAGDTGLALPGPAAWVCADHPAALSRLTARDTDAETLVRAFRRTASRQAVQLSVSFSAVPLTLPVMQLVQRAMQPRSGPAVLAEVLLSGLLERGRDEGWYDFRPGVREALLRLLARGDAQLILKHCGDYVERHFGRRAHNFPALALAGLSGQRVAGPDGDTEVVPDAFAAVSALVAGRFGVSVPATQRETYHLVYAGEDEPWVLWAAHLLAVEGKEVVLRKADGTGRDLRELVIERLARRSGPLRRTVLFIGGWHAEFRLTNPLRGVVARDDDRFAAVSVVRTVPFSWVAELDPVTRLWDTTEAEAAERLLGSLGVARTAVPNNVRRPAFPGPTLRILDGVPATDPDLTVRGNLLDRVRESLAPDRSTAACAVTGEPSVGKTTLAAQYVHRYASTYDIVWWVRPGTARHRRERLAQLGVEFGIPAQGDALDRLVELMPVLWATPLSWLIVFDDCEVQDTLADLPLAGGHVLITTRDCDWRDERIDTLRLAPRGHELVRARDPERPQPVVDEEALVRVTGPGRGYYTGFFLAPGLLVTTVRVVPAPNEEHARTGIVVVTADGRRHQGHLMRVLEQVALFRVPEVPVHSCLWLTDAPDVRPDDVMVCSSETAVDGSSVRVHHARCEGHPGKDTMRIVGDLPGAGGVGSPVISVRDGSVVGIVVADAVDRDHGVEAVRIEALRNLCLQGEEGVELWHDIVRSHDRHHAAWSLDHRTVPLERRRELYGLLAELNPPSGPDEVRRMTEPFAATTGDHPPRSWRDGAGLIYSQGGSADVVRYAARVWSHLARYPELLPGLSELRDWIRRPQNAAQPVEAGRHEHRVVVEIAADSSDGYSCEAHLLQGERVLYGGTTASHGPSHAVLFSAVSAALRYLANRAEADGIGGAMAEYRLPDELLWDLPVERWTTQAAPHLARVVVRGAGSNRRPPRHHAARWKAVSQGPLIGLRSPETGLLSRLLESDLRRHLLNGPANAVPLLCQHAEEDGGATALAEARSAGYPLIIWSRAPRHETCLDFYGHMLEKVRLSSGVQELLGSIGRLARNREREDDWAAHVAVYYAPGETPTEWAAPTLF